MKYTLKNESIAAYNDCSACSFPRYTSQLINLACQNAQGTRPNVVGQMSELFPRFAESAEEISIEAWRKWYTEQHPDAIDKATDKILSQLQNLKEAIALIDADMVRQWVEDLVINKTFNGMYIQKAILASLSERMKQPYRLAAPEEEAIGIDGYVGDTPFSVKPITYKTMARLSETIDVKMVYYEKTKSGLKISTEEETL